MASSSITKYQSREIAIDVHCKQLAKVALVANRLFAEPFVQIFSKVCLDNNDPRDTVIWPVGFNIVRRRKGHYGSLFIDLED